MFHTEAGFGYQLHARTATLALRELRRWVRIPATPSFKLVDVVRCSISQDDYEYSHDNGEMMHAGHTIVNHFWSKCKQCVDADVYVEPYN